MKKLIIISRYLRQSSSMHTTSGFCLWLISKAMRVLLADSCSFPCAEKNRPTSADNTNAGSARTKTKSMISVKQFNFEGFNPQQAQRQGHFTQLRLEKCKKKRLFSASICCLKNCRAYRNVCVLGVENMIMHSMERWT